MLIVPLISKLTVDAHLNRWPRRSQIAGHAAHCMIIAIFVCSLLVSSTRSSQAQIVLMINADERNYIADMISNGSETVDIRVRAIDDSVMIRAIRDGARTRNINILIDQPSAGIEYLSGLQNINIRQPIANKSGSPTSPGQTGSVVMFVGTGGAIREWYGPPIWTRSAFGPNVRIYGSSGAAPWESKTPTREFDSEFATALKLKMPVRRFSVVPIALTIAVAFVGAWIIWKKRRG